MTGITVRPFGNEFERIAIIEKNCFSDPWSENMFREAAEYGSGPFLVAESNGAVIGYILASVCSPEAEIQSIAVEKEYRKLGIGSLLIETFLKDGSMKKVDSVYLEVRTSNEGAIALYEKFGFKKIGIRKNYYRFPREDAIVMALYRNIKETEE